jgi:hypothetical protein
VRKIPAGKRPFDREFVLPNYQSTFKSHVQLPTSLQHKSDEQGDGGDDGDDLDENEIETEVNEDDNDDDDCADDSDAEESRDVIRRRLMKQHEEDDRRCREVEEDQHVLYVTVERSLIGGSLAAC